MSVADINNDISITRTKDGHNLITSSNSYTSNAIINRGESQTHISRIINKFVKPKMKCLDIGSHIGSFSCIIAKKITDQGKLWCFEANPIFSAITRDNLLLNDYVNYTKVYDKGCYLENTKMTLYIPENYGAATVCLEVAKKTFKKIFYEKVVDLIKLDDLLKTEKIDFIKMDIEGAEFEALQGGINLIKRSMPNIVLEWHSNIGAEKSLKFFEFLTNLKYKVYYIKNFGGLELIKNFSELVKSLKRSDSSDYLISINDLE